MAFQTKVAIGYNGSPVAWLGSEEVAWTCGNALVLQSLNTKTQRVLKGTGFGISCFTVSKRYGLIAVAEKALKPNVYIYAIKSLQLLAKLSPSELSKEEEHALPGGSSEKQQQANVVTLGITAMGFSGDGERLVICGDEPDCSVIVYSWRKGEVHGRSRLPHNQPAHQVSFHPLDPTILATTHSGTVSVWYLEAMWDRTLFRYQSLGPGALPPGHDVTVHAWSPHGLYVGTSGGGLALLDLPSMTPLVIKGASAVASAAASEPPSPGGTAGGGGAGGGSAAGAFAVAMTAAAAAAGVAPGQPAVVLDAAGPGAGVSALALNRDHLAVCGTDGSVHVFSQAPVAEALGPPGFSHEVWLARGGSTGVPVSSADCGGPEHTALLLGCPDGTIYCAPMGPHTGAGVTSRAGYTTATQIGDYPVGRLAGIVPHPGGGAFLTAGADGSVRLWAAEDGRLLARKALSSAQCALAAAAPGAGLAAVGSETGVVRVLVLPPAPTSGSDAVSGGTQPSQQLRVMYRRRLHTSAIDALAFSPNNDLLLSAGRDGAVWLLALDARTGSCRALGFVTLPPGERVMAVTWPRAGSDVLDGESAFISLAGGGIMSLTASAELTSGNWRNPNPDLQLVRPTAVAAHGSRSLGSDNGDSGPSGAPEPVVVRLLRLEVPVLAMTTAPHDRTGELYGLGADKQLHKVALPAEAAAWAGLRARPFRSSVHVPAHARAGGGITMAPGGHVLVSGGADGVIAMRNLNLAALGDSSAGGGIGGSVLHDVTAGGVVSVSFDATGRYFASAGADGAIVVFEVGPAAGAAHLLVTPPWPAVPFAGSVTAASRVEADAIDDASELTEVELVRRQGALETGGINGESKRAAVVSKLMSLRSRIGELLEANQAVPELERLERSELIVDVGLVERLKHDTEARVAAVAAAVRRNNLRTELLAERLRRMVWDHLAVKGAVVSGLRSSLVVNNFPLTQPGPHERVLRQVTLLRRVELLEHQALGVVPYNFMFRGSAFESAGDGDDNYDGSTPTPDAAAAAAAAAVAAAAAASATGAAGSDPDTLMYSDFDLHCNTRRALQIHLLRQKIRNLKVTFNTDFNRVAAQKRSDCDRIADLNARMDETVKDLRKMGAGGFGRVRATVLSVRDEEVGVERYITPEERARKEAARRAEEEATKRSARDNAGERALRQMMGGTLAPRGGGVDGDGNPFSLPPPPWLAAMGLDPDTVNPKMLSEEQARELKDWQAREKNLQEERARRVGMLELELRTAKAAVEDVVGRFDEALAGLAARRHRVAAAVAALEARTLALAAGLARCAKTSEAVEKQLLARLGAAKEAHGRAAADLTERRTALTELESKHAAAAAEERQLDRNFKKEFVDADLHFNRLLHMYRARRSEQLVAAAMGTPEGLDPGIWEKFTLYRSSRLEAEAAVRATQVDLALARRDLPELESREAGLATEMDELMSAITALRTERRTSAYDNELQLRLLAGQVEVAPPVGAPADMSDARLLNQAVVEALNAVVLGKGTKKVEILTAMKDFKRGIYAAQWEAAAADMRLEDLRAKIRDLQLLHVTRDMQAVLKDGEDRSTALEAASLEALMKQRERLHIKALDDKRRRLAKLAGEVSSRSGQNQEVAIHLVTLGKVLEEQQRLQAGMQSSTEQAARRMRSLVTHKKLKEIALAQQNELADLRGQVEKARLRTYPTFVELRNVAGMPTLPQRLPPDLKLAMRARSEADRACGDSNVLCFDKICTPSHVPYLSDDVYATAMRPTPPGQ
ncbi:flagellar associated protein, partial [Volvox carteri f. nagariensis]